MDRPRASLGALFLEMLRLLSCHGLRLFALGLLAAVMLSVLVMFYVEWFWRLGLPTSANYFRVFYSAQMIFFVLLMAPLWAGLALAALELLEGRLAGVRTLFMAFARPRLFLNVAVAGAIPFLGPFALRMLWHAIPWEESPPLIDPEAPLVRFFADIPGHQWLAAEVPQWLLTLLFVPLAWGGLEAIVRRGSWWMALAHSARLAWSNRGLALVYFAIVELVHTIHYLNPFYWIRWGPLLAGGGTAMYTTYLATQLVSTGLFAAANMLLTSLALVVFYREYLRRESEAVPPASAVPTCS